MSTIKVDNIDSKDSTGNITVSRPLVATLTAGSINNLNNLLTPANASVTAAKMATTDTLPAWNGSALTNVVPADNSVTGAKLNISLLAGDTMYASGTDTLAKLAKGTAGQLLTMNAGATAPEWADAAGGGAWNLISSTAATNVASVTLAIDTTEYTTYLIRMENWVAASAGAATNLRFGDAGGIDSGASDYSYVYGKNATNSHNHVYNGSASDNRMIIDNYGSAAAANTFAANIHLYAPTAGQAAKPHYCFEAAEYAHDSKLRTLVGGGGRNAVMTLTQCQIFWSSGNIATGRISLFGLSQS